MKILWREIEMERLPLLFMLEEASRDQPVTRHKIRVTFRVTDRCARKMVEELREAGYPVIGISGQEGYWIARTEDELKMFMRDYTAKARTIQKRALKMCGKFYEHYQEGRAQ